MFAMYFPLKSAMCLFIGILLYSTVKKKLKEFRRFLVDFLIDETNDDYSFIFKILKIKNSPFLSKLEKLSFFGTRRGSRFNLDKFIFISGRMLS